MFKLVGGSTRRQTVWAQVDYGSSGVTLYQGQLVLATSDGVNTLGQASGVYDATGTKKIIGIVVGGDLTTPVYSSTYSGQQITSVQSQADKLARVVMGVEGQWSKGDKSAKVEIALLDPTSIVEARLYNSTYGTAPTLLTVTTGSATGAGFTSNATQFTPVADVCTAYCRTGANSGLMAVTTDTSTTVCTVTNYFQNDIAIGDTFVRVPLRPIGVSYVQTDSLAMFFDVSASPATDYWGFVVTGLDLKRAGEEKVHGRFVSNHF